MESSKLVKQIFKEVINPGNCFHCGLCEGITNNLFKMVPSSRGPLPKLIRKPKIQDANDLKKLVMSCPGRGIPYNFLSKKLKTKKKSKIIGNYNSIYVCSANSKRIRKNASSGGIVRSILIELIENNKVDYIYVLDKNIKKILDFEPLITNKKSKIINLSQSIYLTTPFLHKIKELNKNKKYCLVGLPEHIASLRILKTKYPKNFNHFKYMIGIYAGTNMYPGAIEFYLKGNGIKSLDNIKKINWRYGEWPGKLRILTKKNKELTLKKFYYNYLIPFFISKNSLITPDLTSELSDISVGDAWSPKLENKGYGYSVVITRSKFFDKVLQSMKNKEILSLNKIDQKKSISMHAHMLEFKKIGCFLRLEKLKQKGPIPQYDLRPKYISSKRILIEKFIRYLFVFSSKSYTKKLFSLVNPKIMGYLFDSIRKIWKLFTKPTKREGLNKIKFMNIRNSRVKEFE